MHQAVRDDRRWFQSNPVALIRFRTASPGEFAPLYEIGAQPPCFRPSVCRPSAPLRWVAVVDLMRLAGTQMAAPEEPTVRLRVRIPAIRNFKRQEKAKAELLDVVAGELVNNLESEQTLIAA